MKIDNIEMLQILSQDEYRENIAEIFSSAYDAKNCFLSKSSGSTGEPLVFWRDKRWDAYYRTATWRGLERCNVNPWDKSLYLCGFIKSPRMRLKTRFLDFAQILRRFIYDEAGFNKKQGCLGRAKAEHGYSSTINESVEKAKMAKENGHRWSNLRIVKVITEKRTRITLKTSPKLMNVNS